ncbi:MAG: glycosyltransferase family 2 protein [Verrucomicrobiota bacterium]|nr:glycosyltransferase family 2 protein [Verrucomicrobiota bacterium]
MLDAFPLVAILRPRQCGKSTLAGRLIEDFYKPNLMNYSIITATKNSAETLERCLDSVMKQKILPKEYIFVDADSTDETLNIIKSAESSNKNVDFKIIHQKDDSGIYGAFNMGIEEASSELICILNSDDWYEKNAINIVLKAFTDNRDTDILYSSIFFHNPAANKYLRYPRSFLFLPFMMPLAHPTCFIKKNVYKRIGLYDINYKISADYDLIYRAFQNNINFCGLRKPLVNMQLGGTANSSRILARKETLKIALKYCKIKFLPYLAYLLRILLSK